MIDQKLIKKIIWRMKDFQKSKSGERLKVTVAYEILSIFFGYKSWFWFKEAKLTVNQKNMSEKFFYEKTNSLIHLKPKSLMTYDELKSVIYDDN